MLTRGRMGGRARGRSPLRAHSLRAAVVLIGMAFAWSEASAEIVGATSGDVPGNADDGDVQQIAAPLGDATKASLTPGSNGTVFVWNEEQDVVLPAPVNYQLSLPNPDPSNLYDGEDPGEVGPPHAGTLPAGTVVRSHMVHFDGPADGVHRAEVTIDFEMPILAVITACEDLQSSDPLVGGSTHYSDPGPWDGGDPTTFKCDSANALVDGFASAIDPARRGLDWDEPGLPFAPPFTDGVFISDDRLRISIQFRQSNAWDQVRILTEGMLNGGHGFAVAREGDQERICYLGDPGDPYLPEDAPRFTPANFTPLPAAFQDAGSPDMLGSEVALIGVDDAKLEHNVIFSSCFDPAGITSGQIEDAFDILVEGGVLQRWLAEVASTPGECFNIDPVDPDSLSARLADGLGDALGVDPWVPFVDDRTLAAGFGVENGPVIIQNGFPALFALDGEVRPLLVEDVQTETFIVFTEPDGTDELIVNLADLFQLDEAGQEISLTVPASFNSGTLAGTSIALVGFFMEDAPRANLMFSAFGAAPATLADANIEEAFSNLAGSTFLSSAPTPPDLSSPSFGFIDMHSDLGRGEARELSAADATSFATLYGCDAAGPPPGSVAPPFAFGICGSLGGSALQFEVRGAASPPTEYAIVSRVTVDPVTSTIDSIEVFEAP